MCVFIRPLSIGTLAVGCEEGIFIWTIEFSNILVKPIVNNTCKFIRDDHRYVTGLSWNKMVNIEFRAKLALIQFVFMIYIF